MTAKILSKEERKDSKTLWKNANELNDLDAQFQVGHMYAIGNEVSHVPEKSIYWCERAADQYHSKSLCQLGYIYYTGDYVEKYIFKAIRLFEEAALLGDHKSFFNLRPCIAMVMV